MSRPYWILAIGRCTPTRSFYFFFIYFFPSRHTHKVREPITGRCVHQNSKHHLYILTTSKLRSQSKLDTFPTHNTILAPILKCHCLTVINRHFKQTASRHNLCLQIDTLSPARSLLISNSPQPFKKVNTYIKLIIFQQHSSCINSLSAPIRNNFVIKM